MAAWGNLKNIFENQIPDSYSPWGQHLPSTSSASSFEIFGELCHSSSSSTSPPCHPHHQSIASMPEPGNTAAVEIFGELCYAENSDFYPGGDATTEKGKERFGYMRSKSTNERSGCEKVGGHMRSYSDVRQRIAGRSGSGDGGLAGFPPPITTIGSGGKPRVYFKSFRKDGRFVLREIRIPTQRLLQAKREDGRLVMRVLRPRDEEEEEMKEGDKQG